MSKTTRALYEGFKELPTWAKGVIAVGSCVVVYFAVKGIINRIKQDASKKDSLKTVSQASADLKALLNSGMKLSFPLSQYDAYAQKLFSDFDGWGTDNMQVFAVFAALKNKADVLQLIVAFGVRTISSGVGNPTPNTTGDLTAVIADEMNASQIAFINATLANNKIDYKF